VPRATAGATKRAPPPPPPPPLSATILAPAPPAAWSLFRDDTARALLFAALETVAGDAEYKSLWAPAGALLRVLRADKEDAWAAVLAPPAGAAPLPPGQLFCVQLVTRAMEMAALRRAYAQCAGEGAGGACACGLPACGAAKRALVGVGKAALAPMARSVVGGSDVPLARLSVRLLAVLRERAPPVEGRGDAAGVKRGRE
jgi:hypothetical protein